MTRKRTFREGDLNEGVEEVRRQVYGGGSLRKEPLGAISKLKKVVKERK